MTESANKSEIIELLTTVDRKGIPELIDWLSKSTDFFTAPASTKYHGYYSGGLADHSLNVLDSLKLINSEYMDSPIKEESLIVVGLLHDVCKTHYYVLDEEPATSAQMNKLSNLTDETLPENKKTKAYVSKLIDWYINKKGSKPEFSESWKVDEKLPYGHGEKSVLLIQRFIPLSEEEIMAIRWHLGPFDPGYHFFYPSGGPCKQAIETYPLVSMLFAADYLSTWLIERKYNG